MRDQIILFGQRHPLAITLIKATSAAIAIVAVLGLALAMYIASTFTWG